MSFSQTTKTNLSETIIASEKGAFEKWNQADPSGYLDLSADNVTYFDPSIEQRPDGLDKTFDHIDNWKINWIDLDLPDVIMLRKNTIRNLVFGRPVPILRKTNVNL